MQAILLYVLNVYYQYGCKKIFLMIIGKRLAEKNSFKSQAEKKVPFSRNIFKYFRHSLSVLGISMEEEGLRAGNATFEAL